jgi:hypothetical protein
MARQKKFPARTKNLVSEIRKHWKSRTGNPSAPEIPIRKSTPKPPHPREPPAPLSVIPAFAGIQGLASSPKGCQFNSKDAALRAGVYALDSRFRGNDEVLSFFSVSLRS